MNKTTQMMLMDSNEKITVILQQVVEMIKVLKEKEEPSHLDLQQLPLSNDELLELDELLGEGNVKAEVEHLGFTRIYATAIPSLWRVVHFNDEEEILSDFLEVSYCPEIIITQDDDIPIGIEFLKARMFELGLKERKNSGKQKKK